MQQFRSLDEESRERVDEGQLQAAFDTHPGTAERLGDGEVVMNIACGRVADERGIVVDDLVVDRVALLGFRLFVALPFEVAQQLLLLCGVAAPVGNGPVELQQQRIGLISRLNRRGRKQEQGRKNRKQKVFHRSGWFVGACRAESA